MTRVRKFKDLMSVPLLFYRTIGEDLYSHRSTNATLNLLLKIYLYVGFLNFNLLVVGEIIYFVIALQSYETVKSAIAVGPCIAFSFVSDFKQIALAYHKKTLTNMLDTLEDMFPVTREAQEQHNLEKYYATTKRVMYVISSLCLAYTTTFSFYPSLKGTINFYLFGAPTFERYFGFLIWFPYDATGSSLAYWLTSADIAHGAYLAGVAFLCADLTLIVALTQLCMHFDYISRQLEQYECIENQPLKNLKFLQRMVSYHDKCLVLCENVNSIFSLSLLLNFLVASMQICFIAFQVTEATLEVLFIYGIFLTTSLVQVFIVCFYGDELIVSSLRVGDAAYNQRWFQCNRQYNQMLQMLIMRSQKPASIRPPTFPPISLRTFMKVISMSYQFFALLRTTYSRRGD